ncbi:MAG: hypothetical protein EZS28_053784, partial [Streblomastix strix]
MDINESDDSNDETQEAEITETKTNKSEKKEQISKRSKESVVKFVDNETIKKKSSHKIELQTSTQDQFQPQQSHHFGKKDIMAFKSRLLSTIISCLNPIPYLRPSASQLILQFFPNPNDQTQ